MVKARDVEIGDIVHVTGVVGAGKLQNPEVKQLYRGRVISKPSEHELEITDMPGGMHEAENGKSIVISDLFFTIERTMLS